MIDGNIILRYNANIKFEGFAMNIKKYKDKKISILGDSISTFDGVSVPDGASFYDTNNKLASNVIAVCDTWWGQVINKLQAELLINNSISGSTVTFHPSYEIQSYGCSDERTSSLCKDGITPDVIIIYLGTNDWGSGVKIFDENNPNDLTVFFNAYTRMLKKIKQNYPDAEIWCVTLGKSICSKKSNFEFPCYIKGRHIEEYCKAIKRCAKENNCFVVDLFDNETVYDTIDGFHPDSCGMKSIANAVLDCLKNCLKSGNL